MTVNVWGNLNGKSWGDGQGTIYVPLRGLSLKKKSGLRSWLGFWCRAERSKKSCTSSPPTELEKSQGVVSNLSFPSVSPCTVSTCKAGDDMLSNMSCIRSSIESWNDIKGYIFKRYFQYIISNLLWMRDTTDSLYRKWNGSQLHRIQQSNSH